MHRHPTQRRVVHHQISGELSIKTTQTKKKRNKNKNNTSNTTGINYTNPGSLQRNTNPLHQSPPHQSTLLPPTPPQPHKLPHQDSTSTLPPQPHNTPNHFRKATLPPQPDNTRSQPEKTTFPPAASPSCCYSILPPFIANQIPHRNTAL